MASERVQNMYTIIIINAYHVYLVLYRYHLDPGDRFTPAPSLYCRISAAISLEHINYAYYSVVSHFLSGFLLKTKPSQTKSMIPEETKSDVK